MLILKVICLTGGGVFILKKEDDEDPVKVGKVVCTFVYSIVAFQ